MPSSLILTTTRQFVKALHFLVRAHVSPWLCGHRLFLRCDGLDTYYKQLYEAR